MKTHHLVIIFLVGILVLSACNLSGEGTPTATMDPNALSTAIAQTMQAQNPVQAVQSPSNIYQPVENSVCASVQQSLQPLYPTANFIVAIEPFTDLHGVSGTACVISGHGTGNDFVGDLGSVMGAIGTTLPGYIQDSMYAAGGPTGQTSGYRNGNSLAQVYIGWEPSPSVNCPTDKPISECNLMPGDKLYTVMVSMASTGSAASAPALAPTLTPVPPAAANSNPACTDSAKLASEDPQDGAEYKPNTGFRKTWTLTNTGTCTWNSSYQFIFVNGTQMAASGQVKPLVSNTVVPGGLLPIYIDMQSPSKVGDYSGSWSWINGAGKTVPVFFAGGTSQVVTVKIKTQDAVAAAPTAVPTATPVPVASYKPVNDVCNNLHASNSFLPINAPVIHDFTDQNGVSGQACFIYGSGTGDQFPEGGMSAIIDFIAASLPGYIMDATYGSDGPHGASRGYRNGNSLAVVTASFEWELVEPDLVAICQGYNSIDECNQAVDIDPKNMLVLISVSVATK